MLISCRRCSRSAQSLLEETWLRNVSIRQLILGFGYLVIIGGGAEGDGGGVHVVLSLPSLPLTPVVETVSKGISWELKTRKLVVNV
ncbi:hypothetical protein ACFX13_029260 [Malus domestica]